MTMLEPWPRERTSQQLLMAAVRSAVYATMYAAPDRSANARQLPAARDAEDKQAAAGVQQVLVLIAEDEESIAEALALIVEDAGFTALLARNGREALELTRQHHPQLIITDLMMPILNGADFIAAVRTDAASQSLAPPPIIVVTAVSAARAAAAGADAIIMKPFDVTKVETAMRRLLPDDHA